MAQWQLRTDPLTIYMLLLATYGLGMCVYTVHRQSAADEAAMREAAAVVRASLGKAEELVSRPKKRSDHDDLSWLESAQDLLERLALLDSTCRRLVRRAGSLCGSDHTVLGCLDDDVAPRVNNCIVYAVRHSGQGVDANDPDMFFGCKTVSIVIGADLEDNLAVKVENEKSENNTLNKNKEAIKYLQVSGRAQEWVSLPLLVSSGLLLQMKQLLIEIHIPTTPPSDNESEQKTIAGLRGYWQTLSQLSALGFRRVYYLHNPADRTAYPLPLKTQINTGIVYSESESTSLAESHTLYNTINSRYAEQGSREYSSVLNNENHESNSNEGKSDESHLTCGVLLYVYRPHDPVMQYRKPFQGKSRKKVRDEVATRQNVIRYNKTEYHVLVKNNSFEE